MGFSNQEKINLTNAALLSSVLDANADASSYEKVFPFQFNLPSEKVWTQLSNIPEAKTLAQARVNARTYASVIKDHSSPDSALPMTEIPGSNKSTYALYDIPGDRTSNILDNWIQPQQILQKDGSDIGQPSFGYSVRLFNGDPESGGTPISPTLGGSGSGQDKTVAWFFNYAMGLLLLSADFFESTGINKSTFSPYITGFRYTGLTVADGRAKSIVNIFKCDEDVAVGDLVRMVSPFDGPNFTNVGYVVKALGQYTELNDGEVVGVCIENATKGTEVTVSMIGASNILMDTPPTSNDAGKRVYLSSTNKGRGTLTPPSNNGDSVVLVGKLMSVDVASNFQECYIGIDYIADIG